MKSSRVKRSRSARRRTADIQTTWQQDPEYQRGTVEGAQANLHQDYNFLNHLVKVREANQWSKGAEPGPNQR